MLKEDKMASQQELEASQYEKDAVSAKEDATESVEKHKKGPPSVDIKLAQNYKDRQHLPPVTQGLDPDVQGADKEVPQELDPDVQGAHEEAANNTEEYTEESVYVDIILDEEIKADQQQQKQQQRLEGKEENEQATDDQDDGPPRDHVTGRMLSENSQSCIRCDEKGLRCTLNYVDKEMEPRCAACRRAKAPHCVRFRPLGQAGAAIPFHGPPWKNPNFIANAEEGGKVKDLSSRELEDLLREHYLGPEGYVDGRYVRPAAVKRWALPSWKGEDEENSGKGAENSAGEGWRDVLPIWRNRSLRPARGGGRAEEEKKTIAVARGGSARTDEEEGGGEEEKVEAGDGEETELLRTRRKYSPREKNLSDVLGETW